MNTVRQALLNAPTPLAGLSLGMASLSGVLHRVMPDLWWLCLGLLSCAVILLLLLTTKFILHPKSLWRDLSHPVVGSVVPTFAMAAMVISLALTAWSNAFALALWSVAVVTHFTFLVAFVWHRVRARSLKELIPSWFVPPVGLSVAALTVPNAEYLALAKGIVWFGLSSYAALLPFMLYRLITGEGLPDQAKPTLAILAAPASLTLTAYLTVMEQPSFLLVMILLGVALLMTCVIYASLWHLLALPFSPGYAAFTFPLVISPTALFKASEVFSQHVWLSEYANQLYWLATVELVIAGLMVAYVMTRFSWCYLGKSLVYKI